MTVLTLARILVGVCGAQGFLLDVELRKRLGLTARSTLLRVVRTAFTLTTRRGLARTCSFVSGGHLSTETVGAHLRNSLSTFDLRRGAVLVPHVDQEPARVFLRIECEPEHV